MMKIDRDCLRALRQFASDERGATAVEYALLLGGIGLALAAVLPSLAGKMSGVFTNLATNMK